MRRWSIRLRLTAWFTAVFGLVLVAVVAGVWWALADSITDTIDRSLADRVTAVERFLNQPGTSQAAEELREDLREYVSLDPGWSLIRIQDADGVVLYRSEGFAAPPTRNGVPAGARVYRDALMRGQSVRVLSAGFNVRGRPYLVDVAASTAELQEVLSEFRMTVLVLAPLGLLAAALGGYWISGRALAPVDRITATARSISAANLGQRLDVPTTGDELQRLSATLNEMLGRIDRAFQETRRFTADASHELRTPVSVIRTSAEVALRRPRSGDEYRTTLDGIVAESTRTAELLEDLLELARADAGVEPAPHERVDLQILLSDMQPSMTALCDSRGLTFETRPANGPVWVLANRDALRRLIVILVDNAVRYTPAPGSIRVALITPGLISHSETTPGVISQARPSSGAAADLVVEDTGIGIAAGDLPHIFDRFYRADPARSRDSGGAGLGLSIAQSIVSDHGGLIRVESEPGLGTRVRVTLPLELDRD